MLMLFKFSQVPELEKFLDNIEKDDGTIKTVKKKNESDIFDST